MTTVQGRVRRSMQDFISEKNAGMDWYALDPAHKQWMTENPELFSEYTDQAAEMGSKQLLKAVIDAHTKKESIRKGHAEQIELFGFAQAYTIPNSDGTGNLYVPAMQMTLPLFNAHREILEANVTAASKSLADFDLMIDALRPFMKDDESTLGEALDVMERSS